MHPPTWPKHMVFLDSRLVETLNEGVWRGACGTGKMIVRIFVSGQG